MQISIRKISDGLANVIVRDNFNGKAALCRIEVAITNDGYIEASELDNAIAEATVAIKVDMEKRKSYAASDPCFNVSPPRE